VSQDESNGECTTIKSGIKGDVTEGKDLVLYTFVTLVVISKL
jgi:hypothetical protein